ncbi:MAG TPA: cell division protein ZapA [Alphaproteobacteria bacterium]|jgi:cell division protein ZapA|nr:cell division protein ZapA [Alphaproteobacteria bacterium]HPQ50360.1 cell division protein ZapA [Alphaproteobacteria bacterium]HRK98001.1 cell division protein ZapA [Alphaproteobacteria bacterium]
MADITIQIDGRHYPVACDDGQEDRVFQLGAYVDQRIKEVSDAAAGSRSQAMMLASLLLADEVFDMHEKANAAGQAAEKAHNEPRTITYQGLPPSDEQEITTLISKMTERVEQLCIRVQKA